MLPRSSELGTRLQRHLGVASDAVSSTSVSLPVHERVNLQRALDVHQQGVDRWEVIGLQSDIGNYGGVSLPGMAAGQWARTRRNRAPVRAVDVDIGRTVAVLACRLVLTEHDGEPVAVLLYLNEQRAVPEVLSRGRCR